MGDQPRHPAVRVNLDGGGFPLPHHQAALQPSLAAHRWADDQPWWACSRIAAV